MKRPRNSATDRSNGVVPSTQRARFDDFLPYLVTLLAHRLNQNLIETLRVRGINLTRWRILAVLAMGDGITVGEIIERAMMQQSALSRALQTMEDEGLVKRVPRRADGRYVDVFLTSKGSELFNALDGIVRHRQEQLLHDFTDREKKAAFGVIRRLLANVPGSSDVTRG
jgi:DNA-binding MarR family transcriptional regulator